MKKLGVLFAIILMISFVSAASVSYEIVGDGVYVQANFGEVEDFELLLPYDITVFESNAFYDIVDAGNHKLLKVEGSDNLSISYVAHNMIEVSKTKSFFIMKNHFLDSVDVKVFLPEGGVLMKDYSLIFPGYADIGTDGRRVFLEWNNFQDGEIVVGYEIIKTRSIFWMYLFFVLVIGFVVVYVIQSRKLKKQISSLKDKGKIVKKKTKEKKKKDVTRNLFGEEKKIIEYLMEKNSHSCWTKELAKDLDLPKVRLSRKLRNLVQKELISKEPHGNENRVSLLKTS